LISRRFMGIPSMLLSARGYRWRGNCGAASFSPASRYGRCHASL
jgi:hypothetical protein